MNDHEVEEECRVDLGDRVDHWMEKYGKAILNDSGEKYEGSANNRPGLSMLIITSKLLLKA